MTLKQSEVCLMKKSLSFFSIIILCIYLTGCVGMAPDGPETLTLGENSYRTNFYGTLVPNKYELSDDKLEIDSIVLNRIKHESFELYHADIGPNGEGTIYCSQKDYESASSFYSDPENYSHYCILGVDAPPQKTKTVELIDVDTAKFNALLDFADRSNYDPFDNKHNAKIEKVDLPMPDNTKDTRLVFYKESSDQLLYSSKRTHYYIIDGHLYAVYRYDFGHGEYEKLIAVKAPDEISSYFVEYMKPYIQN